MANKAKIEFYIRITKANGKNKDTFAHAADNKAEIIKFIEKHGKNVTK